MHFFGGIDIYPVIQRGNSSITTFDFAKQHFMIEKNRSGKMVQMKKMKDLD